MEEARAAPLVSATFAKTATPHSPHLNRIEVLWRQVKYRWLEPGAYAAFNALCFHVSNIFEQVGTKYRITFA